MPRRGGRSRGGSVRRQGPVTISIEGLDRLTAQIEDLPPEIRQACFKALRESAEAVIAEVKGKVKVDSRNLQTSVKARYQNTKLRAEVGWWDQDDGYSVYQEFGTKKMPANPSLGPALEMERNRIGDRVKTEVRKVLP
ncbi:HK97-gp10 family putative phage morphogenesis protein [Streptomyces sp. NPDC046316]|uniref:HK97-gp10 family putative phage morphogenesis protein n=1 Tax=Streptomyces sp. NPDC046316 TaxID=3154494 RepID=UPI0033C57728